MKVTLERQLRCAQREVQKRQQVYPRLVDNGTMTQHDAEDETQAMQAIVETLQRLVQETQPQQMLF